MPIMRNPTIAARGRRDRFRETAPKTPPSFVLQRDNDGV
jgi:hypothetical protein